MSHESRDTFIVVESENCDGNRAARVFFPDRETVQNSYYDPTNWVCYQAAKVIAFDDLTDEEVVVICAEGHHLEYVGWQPSMRYEFKDKETGEIVWSYSFPNWDY